MAKQKYYVVWEGRKPGLYESWDECKKQVDGFEKAKYKSFESRAEAERAAKGNYWQSVSTAGKPAAKMGKVPRSAIIQDSLAVDAVILEFA